jgi:hypothetical protein
VHFVMGWSKQQLILTLHQFLELVMAFFTLRHYLDKS